MLKKSIAKWLQGGNPQETQMVKLDDIAVSVIMEIDEQPTAYDIEEVVAEIRKQPHGDYGVQEENEIINIVRKGGVE